MKRTIENNIKKLVIDRLFNSLSICASCGRKNCTNHSYRTLPAQLNTMEVLRAINLDENYFKEPE